MRPGRINVQASRRGVLWLKPRHLAGNTHRDPIRVSPYSLHRLLSRSTPLPRQRGARGPNRVRVSVQMTTVADDPTASLIDPPKGGAVAVSYLRVSTREQAEKGGTDEGFSIPAQREATPQSVAAAGGINTADVRKNARQQPAPVVPPVAEAPIVAPVNQAPAVARTNRASRPAPRTPKPVPDVPAVPGNMLG